ncbi:MAG: hypothetical protein HC927_11900 [Deltaproteobacteria bacterium]|nr:hypothetical protein [Deltaproteobacteria bacterium]
MYRLRGTGRSDSLAGMRTSRSLVLLIAGMSGIGLGACTNPDDGPGVIDRGVCDTLIECAAELAPEARDEYEAT